MNKRAKLQFLSDVLQMRNWQKQYFKTRDYKALNMSKKFEKRVDLTLAEFESKQMSMPFQAINIGEKKK